MLHERDARKLSAEGLEDLRRCAVAAVESGMSQTEVGRLYGVSRQTVGAWVRAYRQGGSDGLRPRRRGRRPGDQLALSFAQQLWTLRTVTASTPDQVGLRHVLWTWQSLAELVQREFGVALGTTTIRNYVIRWGFHQPGSEPARTLPTRSASVHGLRATITPESCGGPRRPSTETLWTDRARVRWYVPGSQTGPGTGVSLDSDVLFAVTSRGGVLFMPARDPFDGTEVQDFYARLLCRNGGPVIIVPGWEPTHRKELLGSWISAHTEKTPVGQ